MGKFNMILYGDEVKEYELKKIKDDISSFKSKPKLCIITIGEDFGSSIYVKNKIKLASSLNIDAYNKKFDESSSETEILNYIKKLNEDDTVNGIIVQLPILDKFNKDKIVNAICDIKDVDCFSRNNTFKLYNGSNDFLPCTVQAIIDILNFYKIEIENKNIVIAGRSLIVGKPLFHAFTNLNATVTLCHSKTINIKQYISNADIFISAVGSPKLYTKDYFNENPNITIIDVGINRDINNKICGDVDFDNVVNVVNKITPVPKGVGLLTVVNVVKNTIKNYKLMNEGE